MPKTLWKIKEEKEEEWNPKQRLEHSATFLLKQHLKLIETILERTLISF